MSVVPLVPPELLAPPVPLELLAPPVSDVKTSLLTPHPKARPSAALEINVRVSKVRLNTLSNCAMTLRTVNPKKRLITGFAKAAQL